MTSVARLLTSLHILFSLSGVCKLLSLCLPQPPNTPPPTLAAFDVADLWMCVYVFLWRAQNSQLP